MVRKTKQQTLKTTTVTIYILLFLGLGTYFMPLLQVKLAPLGTKSWSLQQILEPLPQKIFGGGKKKSFKVDYDFTDLLEKVLPRDKKSNELTRLSPTFILGALIPVALIVTYLSLIGGLFLAAFGRGSPLVYTSLIGLIGAAYSMFGVYYLGQAAVKGFDAAVERAGEGVLGFVTRNFVQEAAIQPDAGLFVLLVATLAIFAVGIYRNNNA